MKKTFLFAVFAMLSTTSTASAQVWDCLIDFSDKFALNGFYDQARTHFGIESRLNQKTGKLEACSDAPHVHGTGPAPSHADDGKMHFDKDDWQNCWAYRQRCSYTKFYVNAWPWGSDGNHFHMFFDHPLLQSPLCSCDPGDGQEGGFGFSTTEITKDGKEKLNCFNKENPDLGCPKWEEFSRKSIYPHRNGYWIYLYVEKGGDSKNHVFTLSDITIAGKNDAELWFVKKDGTAWGWKRLKPGYHKLNAKDAISVWISTADDNGEGPVEIKDFVIFPQEPSN